MQHNSRNRCQINSSQKNLHFWSHLNQDINRHLSILQRNNEHMLILKMVLKVFFNVSSSPDVISSLFPFYLTNRDYGHLWHCE